MTKLTKKFVVVYIGKDVVFLSQNNTETYPGKGTEYKEFGSMQELEEFITEKELKVKDTERWKK